MNDSERRLEPSVLVRQFSSSSESDSGSLHELTELARSAGADVCAALTAVRAKPVAATFIASGKVEALRGLVAHHHASLVIFDHPLSPVQERNIEKEVGCRVLDREGLILDIFAQRATSSEGKLQVELAQLNRLSTRLVRGWTHLERQKGGIGLRGPGETQLETDRRLIGMRIKTLTKRLRKVESQRNLRRRARHRTPIPTVSLVGYTNAGKSSLFNALVAETASGGFGDKGAQSRNRVYVADQLFATLDPTMRRLDLPGFGPVVLSDTVGFVRDLPHGLVAAFHSTLEEVTSASCLLLVNDYADPERDELKIAVDTVLAEIGAMDVPRIIVNNKIDLTGEKARAVSNEQADIPKVWLSAESGEGIDLLKGAIVRLLGARHREYEICLSPSAGALRAKLYQRCEVLRESFDSQGGIQLHLRMSAKDRGWLESAAEFREYWWEHS